MAPPPAVEREREVFAGTVLREGLVGGLVAGAILALAEMALAAATGDSPATPWAMAASILLGATARSAPFGPAIFAIGFAVHAILSALFGLLWGAVARSVSRDVRDAFGPHGIAAAIYGALLWLVNFQVIARFVYPWFLEANGFAQLLLHTFFFGLPLGLFLAARLRPIEGPAVRRRRPA